MDPRALAEKILGSIRAIAPEYVVKIDPCPAPDRCLVFIGNLTLGQPEWAVALAPKHLNPYPEMSVEADLITIGFVRMADEATGRY